jgi:hypothetical protein
MCISGVCKKLLDAFDEDDTATYVALLKEYARFRRECASALRQELSK